MKTAPTCTIMCFEQFDHKLMRENKSLPIVHSELLEEFKQAPHDTTFAIHKIIAITSSKHLFSPAGEKDMNLPPILRSSLEQNGSELQNFSEYYCGLWTADAKTAISRKTTIGNSNMNVSFCPS